MPTTYAIPNGRTVMDATLWTGDATAQTITNQYGFRPDFVWAKSRSNAGTQHIWEDSVRGASVWLASDLTSTESSLGTGPITAFNSNGFTAGSGANGSGRTYVGWQWQAGQGTTSSNTDGSITSTVSANATAGFSVVTYAGTGATATVGHGLGVAPAMIIFKNRSTSINWLVYHQSVGNGAALFLDLTDAAYSSGNYFNSTSPNSSVFTVKNATENNGSGNNIVAYCWAQVPGFSAFGSYTGNGSADGPFIYTGFRPKFVMVKRTDTTGNWINLDSTRNPYNSVSYQLLPNVSDAEYDVTNTMDFVSNGFKLRDTNISRNANGGTYVYACFAENPFKFSNAR